MKKAATDSAATPRRDFLRTTSIAVGGVSALKALWFAQSEPDS